MNKNTGLVILNTISFLIVLFISYASQTTLLSNITMPAVAHKYDTLFAPADYAFIIWSVIYVGCASFIIYQWMILKNDLHQYIQRTGIWFTLTNLLNALWVYCWIHEWLGCCVLIMLLLLLSLIILTVRLRLELDDEPVRTIFFVWWPVTYYLGWILVATIACIASWLVSINWNGLGIQSNTWAIIMIAVALLIYIFLTQNRNMREAATVGIWAFIAIAVRRWNGDKEIAIAAIISCIILVAIIARHGYKNRYYAPGNKIKRGEWK